MQLTKWKDRYKTLPDYYDKEYNKEYFEFDEYEQEIDPDETLDDFETYDKERQNMEIAKCSLSFSYFATKYVKILHPKKGLVPFVLYKYQKDVISKYEDHRFNIIRKFRQGGLTTVTEIWGMWRCLFKLDQQILFVSKTDSEAITAGEIVNNATKYLPSWMQPSKEGKWNDHKKEFLETGGKMIFGTADRARGLAITYLILDEAAFIPDMETQWKAIYPTLSTGGNCIVVSTVNGLGNWYERIYHEAEAKANDFNVINLSYTSHPEYNNPKWVREQKKQLGIKGWLQEVEGSFLDSGSTYISAKIIGDLQNATRNNYPLRKKFAKWINNSENMEDNDGAFWIWKEPKIGQEYIFGIDCAEGVGDDGDSSVIEIFDSSTLEQVAEFYSNSIPPYIFSQLIFELGIYYNTALVVIESNSIGCAVLSNLQHELHYENLYYGELNKPGMKITMSNRPIILECLQHRLTNSTMKINSRRFVKELNTFIYNRQTQKVQATKGNHDDAIMAVAIAIYIRDSILRDIPIGAEVPKELQSPFKNSIYEEIKREILEDAPMRKMKNTVFEEENMHAGIIFNFKRKNSKLLKEFDW